jgi:hypothetical protein
MYVDYIDNRSFQLFIIIVDIFLVVKKRKKEEKSLRKNVIQPLLTIYNRNERKEMKKFLRTRKNT